MRKSEIDFFFLLKERTSLYIQVVLSLDYLNLNNGKGITSENSWGEQVYLPKQIYP